MICAGTTATLTINGSINGSANWKIYTGGCSGTSLTATTANNFTVNPLVTTSYYVKGEGGCAVPGNCSSLTVSVSVCTDIAQVNLNSIFSVYPNPVTDALYIRGEGLASYQVMIYDAIGRLVISHFNQGMAAQIYLSDLPTGIYQVKIITESGTVIKKVIKD